MIHMPGKSWSGVLPPLSMEQARLAEIEAFLLIAAAVSHEKPAVVNELDELEVIVSGTKTDARI